MKCRKPVKAWKGQNVNPETGLRPVAFEFSEGFFDLPLEFGCGQCIPCRLAWASSWSARADAEARLTERPCYTVTLTYDDDHLVVGGGSRSTVLKADLQRFFKRARFALGPFRYIASGEYGEESERAHYHASLFGVKFDDLKRWKMSPGGGEMFISRQLEKLWGQGLCSVQPFSVQGAAYVAKYVLKSVKGQGAEAAYSDREPPFFLTSRKPGIGSAAWEKYKEEWSTTGEMGIGGGSGPARVVPLPAFYMAKMREEFPERFEILRARRAALAACSAKSESPFAEFHQTRKLKANPRYGA